MADKPPDEHHTIYATRIIAQVEVSGGSPAVAPTSVLYGPFVGPLGGPV